MLNEQKKLPKQIEYILERGWQIVPLLGQREDSQKGGKRPRFKNWLEQSTNEPNQALNWLQSYSDMNWGLLPAKSNVVVIDIDDYSGGGNFWDDLGMVGMVSKTPTVRTPNGGYHLYFAVPDGLEIPYGKRCEQFEIPNMVVIPPSRVLATKTNGHIVEYQWALPSMPDLQELPARTIEIIKGINTPTPQQKPLISNLRASQNGTHPYIEQILQGELDKVSHAPEGERNSQLFKSVARVSEFLNRGDIRQTQIESLFEAAAMLANTKGHDNPIEEIRKTIQSGIRKGQKTPKSIPERPTGKRYNPQGQSQPHIPEIPTPQGDRVPPVTDPVGLGENWPQFVDKCSQRGQVGDAELFAKMFYDQIAYDHSLGKWYLWDGEHWREDRRKQTGNLLTHKAGGVYQKLASKVQGQLPKENGEDSSYQREQRQQVRLLNKKATDLYRKGYRRDVLELASEQPTVARSGEEWGSEPHWLPVKNGVIDLTAQQMMNNHPRMFVKDWTPTEYHDLNATCPTFEQFLYDIFDGDKELLDFMHKLLGYAVSGFNREHIFPIFYGSGANGKGTLIRALQDTLGRNLVIDGATSILQDTDGNSPTAGLMATKDARIVVIQEAGKRVVVNAEQVKKLTGGDGRTGRHLYKEQENWEAQDTLILATNHKPYFDAHDKAIWRRVLLIPFTQSFVGREDVTMQERLKSEAEGIQAWLIRGFGRYLREGLNPPDSVKMATEDYRQSVDELAEFIQEMCIEGEIHIVKRSLLYREYKEFCKVSRYATRNKRDFFDYFRNHYEAKLKDGIHYFKGVGLRRQV